MHKEIALLALTFVFAVILSGAVAAANTSTNTSNITNFNSYSNTGSNTTSDPAAVKLENNASTDRAWVGTEFEYDLFLTNNGPDAATGVTVSDRIPTGFTFDRYQASQGTYDATTGVWNVGTILKGSGANATLFFTPTASVAGTNVTSNAYELQNEPNPNAPISASNTIYVAKVNLNLIKSASNLTPNVGQQFYYGLIINNMGPDYAEGVGVFDLIPADGLTLNSYTSSQGTYYPNLGEWVVGVLNKGAFASLQLFVTPTASLAGKNVTNTAFGGADENNAPVTATVNIHVIAADVQLAKTTSNSAPNVGQKFNYTVTATNNGPDTATGVKVTDKIPAKLTFNSYTSSQGTYNSATGIWNVGTILNSANAWLKIYVTPTAAAAGKTITNTANKTAQNEYDPTTPDTAKLTVHVPEADVQLAKATSNSKPYVGENFYYTINAKNNGPDKATGVRITDVIPAGLKFTYYTSYTSSQGTYNTTTGVWNVGTILKGANAWLKIYIAPTTASAGKIITNTATKTAQNEYDPTTPDTASAVIKVPNAITISQLEAASLYVKNYYESHNILPVNVKIAGQLINMPQFLQLLVTGTLNIKNGNLNPLNAVTVNPAPSPSGIFGAGNLFKSEYLNVARNIKNFINNNGRAPNFATTSLGNIRFSKLVYMYSKIVNFYGLNNRLPNYVSIAP